ncbi:Piso0_000727 [Millerozyma farinosa CBS 7064]|uniref:Piso0_000727 protein n=1 Tax=Pichia sorbitophila (strain ATCC MYA-4447 / BCRC 22081 / CBS 7064 / NBRC 10061 / NRRL Y-12695) TaxID=559304 RepID=G8YPW4_PICSO|nr:Piso0_000727 [Millerozyma farinosa CBS 7064]
MYTCNSCQLAFKEAADQRSHMKTEWHRYNLKRRVAQLPPIDEDSFSTKVASLSVADDTTNQNQGKAESKRDQRRREKQDILQKKREILARAREAMMKEQSTNNEDTSSKADPHEGVTGDFNGDVNRNVTDADITNPTIESQKEIEERIIKDKMSNKVDIPVTTCLFCHTNKKANFPDIDDVVEHMSVKHGLYIPESRYLVDREGLLKYLGEKIGLGNVCLCCNYQGKDIWAVREHMLTKRHMKIPYELEDEKLEISDFYDFSSSYKDDVKADTTSHDEEDWEDVSSDSEGENDDEDLNKEDNDDNTIYQAGHELILPSGKALGHRSLARYYRQNLAPERVLSEGQGTVVAAESRHMLTVRDRKELATQKRAWSDQRKREQINDKRSAKFINQQAHYRDQLLQ